MIMWDKNIQVLLNIPKEKQLRAMGAHPDYHKYNGMTGRIVASAGFDGVWVTFCDDYSKYIGCPLEFLEKVN
jgi:hypothetical protein